MRRFFYVLLSLLTLYNTYSYATMENYCEVPPFLTSVVPPNILFVVDFSGSMSWAAYYKTWSATNDPDDVGVYDDSKVYEGYFIPDKIYKKVGGVWVETNQPENCTLHYSYYRTGWGGNFNYYNSYRITGVCSGNKLNFARMARVDLLRWAITGGKPSVCPDSSYGSYNFYSDSCDPDIVCTGQTCDLITNGMYNGLWYFQRDIVRVPVERINGIAQVFEKGKLRPRFGLLIFSESLKRPRIYIGDYPENRKADPDRPYTYFKRAINSVEPGGATATAKGMWEAYDYFKQSDDHPFGTKDFVIAPGTYKDPLYFCDSNGRNCKKVPCVRNYVILASDGQWNTDVWGNISCSINDGFEFMSSDPAVAAYRMHTDVLRVEESLAGVEYEINVSGVYTLGLFLGGTGEQSLKNVAMYGSFNTSFGSWPDDLDDYPKGTCWMDDCSEWYGMGKGSACTPLPLSTPDWDKNGDGVPDTFLNAHNATEIKKSLLKFLRDILKKVSSGSSVSVLAEKQKKGSTVIQAVFYPEKNFGAKGISWIGHVYEYWFLNTKTAQNMREDTNEDKELNILDDYIIEFLIDSSGNLFIDAYESDPSGRKSSLARTYNSIDDVHHLWDAGEHLKNMTADSRRIYGVSEDRSMKEFIPSNKNDFDEFLGSTDFPDCLTDGGSPDYEKLIMYIRGEDFDGCRDRTTEDGNVWKLADIINSSPLVVNYGDFSITFVGANDGMFHAFTSGYIKKQAGSTVAVLCESKDSNCGAGAVLGEEIWAFIPKNAMPYLRYLAEPGYCHIYFVDLSPYGIELDYDGDGNVDKRIVIGGFRLGGGCDCTGVECVKPPSDTCPNSSDPSTCVGLSSYFAIDVTDPYRPRFLWEFTHQDLGFSYSGPAYIKRKSGNTWKHFIMFASGPTSFEGHSNKPLSVFVLDLLTGNLLKQYTVPALNNSFGGKLFTNGLDINGDGQTDYVFLGYTKNVGTTSQGGVLKIWTGDANPDNWEFDKQYFNLAHNPVTAKVESMICFGKPYVFFGTGRFFYKEDDETTLNALYGVPFLCDENNNCETGSINSAHSVDLEPLPCENIADKTQGAWMITLRDNDEVYLKERNISNPTVSNFNAVFFTTTRPTSDLCSFGGRNRSWAFNCATGERITSKRCQGYTINIPPFKYLVQLSGGNIAVYGKNSFTEEGGRATEEGLGIPSESGGKLILPSEGGKLRILLWLEK